MDKTLVFGLPKNSKVVSIVRTDTCMYDTCMTPLRQKPRPAEAFEAPGKPFAWHRSENEMHPSQLGVRQNSSGTALILTFSPGRRNSRRTVLVLRMSIRQIQSRAFAVLRRMILPLLEERAGVRSSPKEF